jgi:adenine-specific DNA glycosylase
MSSNMTDEQKKAIIQARDDLWSAVDVLSGEGYFSRARDLLESMQNIERAFGIEPRQWP